ncbi:hypothetical protein HNQ07_004688 [Deinococcus metalli]|uniref:Uncharacterized protein n=1 Tax=Deinococcus metalli TaxID=1141878 RepID=A0A7W8NTI8_9DEIO|nr:hypothetical protein [Deinococcus metalli]MBB5379173.1 hypothetical protein [Deinococcus metalli]GHF64691.1 hypothetical protein GCM10017781_45700 [Deinococcus metalli]
MSSTPSYLIVPDGTVVVRPGDIEALRRLYRDDAWHAQDVAAQLGDPGPLLAAGLIMVSATVMGPLTHLSPRGFRLIGVPARDIGSLARRLNRAYLRYCIQALGYSSSPAAEHLKQHDTTELLVPVVTPHHEYMDGGLALVGGSMPNGLSNTTMRRVIRRHNSSALYHGYWVILLTPNSRRGQRHAQRHAAWLKIICVRPRELQP